LNKNILLTYPSFAEEVEVVRSTTTDEPKTVNTILTSAEIVAFQHLVRKVPVPDNVIEYAVRLANKTRPQTKEASPMANEYLEWGAGPRASQYLVLGAKCNALLNNKYSPDIEDIQAIAKPVLRHRIVRNFKAEAEGISVDELISRLMS
jgi:MoxR-like ATPase